MNYFKALTKKEPEKKLIMRLPKKGGRGGMGRITIRHQGAGAKQMYRMVSFGQDKLNIPGRVIALEYDPNRTSFIALVEYTDKDRKYIIAPDGLKAGDEIICAEKAEAKLGNRMKIKNIPVGSQVYNIELTPGLGGKIVRSAGSSAKVQNHEDKYTLLIMPSTEIRMVSGECYASVGQVSFPEHRFIRTHNAGTNRRKGIRPSVRGSAMNPVDHPHGGGEGRQPRGMHPKTPWGKPAFGVKTRNKKKWTSKLIVERRKKKSKK